MSAAADAQAASERRLCGGAVRLLSGHTARVCSLAWAVDGSALASASDDGTVRLWRGLSASLCASDVPAGVAPPPTSAGAAGAAPRVYCAGVLRGHGAPVDAVAWCPAAGEKHLLASAAGDGSLRLWDTREAGAGPHCGALLAVPGLAETEHLAWRPDGARLAATTRSDELLLFELRGGAPALAGRVRMPLQLNEIAWAPSGLLFAACVLRAAPLDEGHLVVLRVADDGAGATPVLQVLAHTMAANAIAFDRTFRTFATGGSDSIVALWDAADVTCVRTFDRCESLIRSVSFSADSTMIAAASDDKVLEIVRLRAGGAAAARPMRCSAAACHCARPCRATPLFSARAQTRVQDGSRVRGLPQVDPTTKVAFAPHCNILAFSVDDARSPRVEHHCVRLLVPAHA
jgi:WD40 repeat protein